jgi:hypothetical protein
VRRPVSTPRRLKAAQVAVKGGVIGHAVLPTAPENTQPGPTEGANRVGMVLAARPCPPVDLAGPRPVPGRVGEGRDRVAQPLVAGPAEADDAALAGLDSNRANPGVRRQRGVGRVALARVAKLGDQLRRADDRLSVTKQRREDPSVGMGAKRASDLRPLGPLQSAPVVPFQGKVGSGFPRGHRINMHGDRQH